jgi:hypothetical protein
MLERTGRDWLLAMYELYFDDSGTSTQSQIAIAACYISRKRGWDEFVREWDAVAYEEGFGGHAFHMADFLAPKDQGKKPWCDWDGAKMKHVYERLAKVINVNKQIGIAVAIPKAVYNNLPERIRKYHGSEHYTFAVRMCLMRILDWRIKSQISLPMQYVFDWEEPWTAKYKEITGLMGGVHEKLKPFFGLDGGGFSFQHKEVYKPLQAADILAWQMNNYMPKIYPHGECEENLDNFLHSGFKLLRMDQEMDLGFFTESYMKAWIKKIDEYEETYGQYYES